MTKGPADILTACSAQHLLPICADLEAVYVFCQPRRIEIKSFWNAGQSAIARPFAYLSQDVGIEIGEQDSLEELSWYGLAS